MPPPFDDAPLEQQLAREVRMSARMPAWRLIETRHGVTYTWGSGGDDRYDPFWVYKSAADDDARLAIGECQPTTVRDRERKYLITHRIGPFGGMRAVAEFVATDDHDETGELIAVIKGKHGSARLFDPDDDLPAAYAGLRIERYRDRIDRPGSYYKAGLVVAERDHQTMLAHTAAQIRIRRLDRD